MSSNASPPPPVVCTLTTKALSQRRLEWSDVTHLALTRTRLVDGVAMTYDLELADDIEDLAQRELSCCGTWLHIATERQSEAIRLELTTANPDGLGIILEMSGESGEASN